MAKLSIVLTGEIQNSNFDEWKSELIEQIRSVKQDLVTDDDFAAATKHVKEFKKAEKTLKAAKASALDQAAEISKLFEAIDTVTEEARQARLSLDRQIKKRKKEIKAEFVTQGVDTIKAFIETQSDAFQSISHAEFIDKEIFRDAISGKASSKGMQKAITNVCSKIKEAITNKATVVEGNQTTLDSLPDNHKLLFQDRDHLLSLPQEQLNKTIDERIANLASAESKSSNNTTPVESAEVDISEESQASKATDSSADADKSHYTITVEIFATEDEADAVRSDLVKSLKPVAGIGNITLSAV